MELEPINHKPLNETVYERILHAIASGRFLPGTKVTLSGLAKQLGVSLMPVREALRRLEAENLVSMKNRRIVIKQYSENELRELLTIRLHLESLAAQKAATNSTQETTRKLENLMDQMDKARGFEAYLEKNRLFHLTLYSAAKMPILLDIIQDLWFRVSPYLHIYTSEVHDYETKARPFHEGMLDGMKRNNPKEVRKWLERDLRTAARNVLRLLRRKERHVDDENAEALGKKVVRI
jgi:DNA-binding GntR family transcriptional regulator